MSDGRPQQDEGVRAVTPAAGTPNQKAEPPKSRPNQLDPDERERVLREKIDRLIERKRREENY